jgi:quinol monooxygenase YgiN
MTTQGTVTVVATFAAREGREQDVRELLTWMVAHTRKEPGCVRYDLYGERGDARTFVLVESYQDADALEAHRATDHYVDYRRRIPDMLEEPIAVTVLEPIDVAG